MAIVGGLLLGLIDLLAQRTVPYPWASLANSSAVWAIGAFGIGPGSVPAGGGQRSPAWCCCSLPWRATTSRRRWYSTTTCRTCGPRRHCGGCYSARSPACCSARRERGRAVRTAGSGLLASRCSVLRFCGGGSPCLPHQKRGSGIPGGQSADGGDRSRARDPADTPPRARHPGAPGKPSGQPAARRSRFRGVRHGWLRLNDRFALFARPGGSWP